LEIAGPPAPAVPTGRHPQVVGARLNDIQTRLVNTLAVVLAMGAHGDVKETEKALEDARAALRDGEGGRVAEDARLGDSSALARLSGLRSAVAELEAAHARAAASIASEEASDFRDLIGKVQEAEAAAEEEEGRAAAAAAAAAGAAADEAMVCDSCGNDDPTQFLEDSRAGDVVCRRCGSVLSERRVVDKDWTRGAFADEGDMTQQGPPVQALHSGQWNLRTAFGASPGVSKADLAQKRRLWAEIERRQETAEVRTGSRTTAAYRDRMKTDAFSALESAGERLRLHRAIVERGKALFSRFRDRRENVHRFRAVVAASMAVACAEAGVSSFPAAAAAHSTAGPGADLPAAAGGAAGAAAAGDDAEAADGPPPDRETALTTAAPSADARPRLMSLGGSHSRLRQAIKGSGVAWDTSRREAGPGARALKRPRAPMAQAAEAAMAESATVSFLGGGSAAGPGSSGPREASQPAPRARRAPSRVEQLAARARALRAKRAKAR